MIFKLWEKNCDACGIEKAVSRVEIGGFALCSGCREHYNRLEAGYLATVAIIRKKLATTLIQRIREAKSKTSTPLHRNTVASSKGIQHD